MMSQRRKPVIKTDFGAAFLASTPDAVFLIENGVITECNEATERMYHYARADIIGNSPEVFSTPTQPCGRSSAEMVAARLQEAMEHGSARFTWTNQDRNGRLLPLLVTLAVADVNGSKAVLVSAQDYAQTDAMIRQISSSLKEVAAGDLTQRVEQAFQPEYEAIRSNLNATIESVSDLIGAMSESTAAVQVASSEIAQSSEDLARRTEGDAASLEETAAAITQMDGRLKASATAANRTVERADQAVATINSGREVAEEAMRAMERVSESTRCIDGVIEGLDKIAFQTRVLAMNAAIEAGRVGAAGGGFAVVADLVSALAKRSEDEAKRARDQLKTAQNDIVTAVGSVANVDGALADISGDVARVHELLATMAADNDAQAAAVTQISVAVGTIDQSTQQNAAMVEETSAAARNLASEIGGLAERAKRFKVARGDKRTRR